MSDKLKVLIGYYGTFFLILFLVYKYKPEVIPFQFFEFWTFNGWGWIKDSLPLFLWGFLLTAAQLLFSTKAKAIIEGVPPRVIFFEGAKLSIKAGIMEEIWYRWIFFLCTICVLTFFDYITSGWIYWLFRHITGPLANLFTDGRMKELIYTDPWIIGATILSVNRKFRNGHAYQGLFGWVNSWFCGMYLFWVVFNYGIIAAIAVHTIYNLIIDATLALMAAANNRQETSLRSYRY